MKRSVTILIVLTMVLMLFPTTIWAGATEVTVSDAEELKSAFEEWDNDEEEKNVKLEADIEIDEFAEVVITKTNEQVYKALRLGAEKKVNLDLNGHKVLGHHTDSGEVCMILVEGGELTIISNAAGGEISLETEDSTSVSSVIKIVSGFKGQINATGKVYINGATVKNKGASIDACVIDLYADAAAGAHLYITGGVFINSSQTATIKMYVVSFNPLVAKVSIADGTFVNYGAGECIEICNRGPGDNVAGIITIESGKFSGEPDPDYFAEDANIQTGAAAEISLGLDPGYYMIIPIDIQLGKVNFDQGNTAITQPFSVGISNFIANKEDRIVVSIASDNKLRNGSGFIEYELYKGTGDNAIIYNNPNAEFASFSITDTSDKNGEVRVDIANLSSLPAGNYTGQLIFFFGFEE